jgi:hypothetical protein
MGKPDKPKIPAAPDPSRLIGLQAQVNRINQVTPFGSVTYGGPNRSDLTLALSPQFQALLDAQAGFGVDAAQRGRQFLGATNLSPAAPQDVSQIGQAMFDLGASRAMPFFANQEAQLLNQLEQSGNPAVGAALSPGAVSERDLFNRSRNTFLSDLALNSITQATGQRGALLQQDLAANAGNAQIAALLAGASPVQAPGLNQFYGPGPVDVMGPYNLQMQQANAQAQLDAQQRGGFFGGLFDLGSAALGGWMMSGGNPLGALGGMMGGMGGRGAPMGLDRYGVF